MGNMTKTDMTCTEHVGMPFAAFATPILSDPAMASQGTGVSTSGIAGGLSVRDRADSPAITSAKRVRGGADLSVIATDVPEYPTTPVFANGVHRSASWSYPV